MPSIVIHCTSEISDGIIEHSQQFLWDDDHLDLPPPCSPSRSIDFGRIRRSKTSALHPAVGAEDLYFNTGNDDTHNEDREVLPEVPLGFNSVVSKIKNLSSDGFNRSYMNMEENLAPAGINYDRVNNGDKFFAGRRTFARFSGPHTSYSQAAAFSLGDRYPKYSFREALSSIVIETLAKCRAYKWASLFLVLVLLLSAFVEYLAVSSTSSRAVDSNADRDLLNRTMAIKIRIIKANISLASSFEIMDSPQNNALRWISQGDPLHLDPLDSEILLRYVLCVFSHSTRSLVSARIPGEGGDDTAAEDEGYSDYNVARFRDKWDSTKTWLSELAICNWHGITCKDKGETDKTSGSVSRIIHLNLTKNGIHGSIPRELFFVLKDDILSIDLSENFLTGTVPTEIAQLASLRYLSLSNNLFSGTLPSEIGSMSNVQLLSLYDNQFSSILPSEVGRLSNLVALYLDMNRFSGQIPISLGNLRRKLVDLRLSHNRFAGSIPPTLFNLERLEILYLDNNKLEGTLPPNISNLRNILHLHIQKNQFTAILPTGIGSLMKMKQLFADNNNLTGRLPSELGQLISLKQLWLEHNKFLGPLPATLSNLTSLQVLRVHDNYLTGEVPKDFCELAFNFSLKEFVVNCKEFMISCFCCTKCL